MDYTGKNNANCPICGQAIKYGYRHPVIYRVDTLDPTGHMWCSVCFYGLWESYNGAVTERHIETFQNTTLKDTVDLANKTAETWPIKGFWFCDFNKIGLGLVVNYSTTE
jgi:hypothetical protein